MLELTLNDFVRLPTAEFLNLNKLDWKERLSAICTDSRAITKGEVFWTLVGERFDAHDFLNDIYQKGARFAVVQKDRITSKISECPAVVVTDTLKALQQLAGIQRGKYKFPVIALTGSNGKTTTKEMIAHVLSQKMNIHKTTGNLNNHIGCPLTLLALNSQHQAAVIELGSNHPGEIALLVEIVQPDHAIITNVGGAHLEFFKTLDNVAREKISLFDGLKATGWIYKNLDDEYIRNFSASQGKEITYSLQTMADVRGRFKGLDQSGNGSFTLNDRVEIRLRAPGRHNVQNALAACAVALNLNFSEPEIKDALEMYEALDRRMQVVNRDGVTIVNDAYNANPASMFVAIDSVCAMQRRGKLYLALGDMLELGDQSANLHAQVLGRAIEAKPDGIFLYGSAMRQALETLDNRESVWIESLADHDSIARALRELLQSGDILLLKGSRGMAMEKVLNV